MAGAHTQLVIACWLLVMTPHSSDTALVYSSFWAPLFDRRLLNYRVDAAFDPDAARSAREKYTQEHGYRGEKLIAELGNRNGPSDMPKDVKVYGDVKFYYT